MPHRTWSPGFGDDVDEDDAAGFEPWALGDADLEPLAVVDEEAGVGEADGWLDEQLARLQPDRTVPGGGHDGDTPLDPDTPPADGSPQIGRVVLRRPAPGRGPRRRRADPDAAADVPAPSVPGYLRDRRGTWRYTATGQAVPGARDLTLRSLYRFPVHHGSVHVPVDLVRTEAELGWCLRWRHTLTTRLNGRRSVTVLRIPVGEWDRRADVPFGLWAPELTAGRLLGISDVAQLAGVSPATITAYLSRRRMPEPVMRVGHTPLWSRPVIRQWLAARPGQGRRTAG